MPSRVLIAAIRTCIAHACARSRPRVNARTLNSLRWTRRDTDASGNDRIGGEIVACRADCGSGRAAAYSGRAGVERSDSSWRMVVGKSRHDVQCRRRRTARAVVFVHLTSPGLWRIQLPHARLGRSVDLSTRIRCFHRRAQRRRPNRRPYRGPYVLGVISRGREIGARSDFRSVEDQREQRRDREVHEQRVKRDVADEGAAGGMQ